MPAFGQSVKKESFFNNGSYNPAPGQYTNNQSTFKGNYIAKQLAKESGEDGVFYIIENGNLQKKVQPYAADRVQRFVEAFPPPRIEVGPGAYNLAKPVLPPPTLPTSTALLPAEAPIKEFKKKLQ